MYTQAALTRKRFRECFSEISKSLNPCYTVPQALLIINISSSSSVNLCFFFILFDTQFALLFSTMSESKYEESIDAMLSKNLRGQSCIIPPPPGYQHTLAGWVVSSSRRMIPVEILEVNTNSVKI